ncbi:hypothetical protein AB0K89_26240 [Streptomyces cinnamoneus]|uniref:hypothetical protein n=1 Tax=Streptomyces cinnamoneus TaxID=53446 RepID=UPI00343313FB
MKENQPSIDISPEMRQAFVAAQERNLQHELRVLADRIRAAAEARPGQSAQFNAGVEWAVLYIENVASGLTEGRR